MPTDEEVLTLLSTRLDATTADVLPSPDLLQTVRAGHAKRARHRLVLLPLAAAAVVAGLVVSFLAWPLGQSGRTPADNLAASEGQLQRLLGFTFTLPDDYRIVDPARVYLDVPNDNTRPPGHWRLALVTARVPERGALRIYVSTGSDQYATAQLPQAPVTNLTLAGFPATLQKRDDKVWSLRVQVENYRLVEAEYGGLPAEDVQRILEEGLQLWRSDPQREFSSPSANASASPTPSRAVRMNAVLRDVAVAEETYFTEARKYLAFIDSVPTALTSRASVSSLPGVRVGVALLPKNAWCAVAFDTTTKMLSAFISNQGGIDPRRNPANYPEPCKQLVRTLQG